MGKKKKRQPHKERGSRHGHRVFTETARYQRIHDALEGRPKKLDVDFEGLAASLNEYVARFELDDFGPLRAFVRAEFDAESARDILIKYWRDPSGNSLANVPIDLYTNDPEAFKKSYLATAIRSFFKYNMHRAYVGHGD